MDTTTAVQRHSEKFPKEIAAAIDGLSGDRERAVLILLFDGDKMAFTELQNELGDGDEPLHQGKLSPALSNLKSGGLIRKKILDDSEAPYSSYYMLSEYGERFIYSLFDSLGSVQGPAGRRQNVVFSSMLEDDLTESGIDFTANLEEELISK